MPKRFSAVTLSEEFISGDNAVRNLRQNITENRTKTQNAADPRNCGGASHHVVTAGGQSFRSAVTHITSLRFRPRGVGRVRLGGALLERFNLVLH